MDITEILGAWIEREMGGGDGQLCMTILTQLGIIHMEELQSLDIWLKSHLQSIFNGSILLCSNNSYHILGVYKLPVSLTVCSIFSKT